MDDTSAHDKRESAQEGQVRSKHRFREPQKRVAVPEQHMLAVEQKRPHLPAHLRILGLSIW
jgi:hypothetical protein